MKNAGHMRKKVHEGRKTGDKVDAKNDDESRLDGHKKLRHTSSKVESRMHLI